MGAADGRGAAGLGPGGTHLLLLRRTLRRRADRCIERVTLGRVRDAAAAGVGRARVALDGGADPADGAGAARLFHRRGGTAGAAGYDGRALRRISRSHAGASPLRRRSWWAGSPGGVGREGGDLLPV